MILSVCNDLVSGRVVKIWGLDADDSVARGIIRTAITNSMVGGICALLHAKYLDAAIQRPVLGMACVTGCYAAAVSLWSAMQMRSLKKASIKMKKLAGVLKCKDIEIE